MIESEGPLKRHEQLQLTKMTADEIVTTGDSPTFGFLFKRQFELIQQVQDGSIMPDDLRWHFELTLGLMDAFGEDGLQFVLDLWLAREDTTHTLLPL